MERRVHRGREAPCGVMEGKVWGMVAMAVSTRRERVRVQGWKEEEEGEVVVEERSSPARTIQPSIQPSKLIRCNASWGQAVVEEEKQGGLVCWQRLWQKMRARGHQWRHRVPRQQETRP